MAAGSKGKKVTRSTSASTGKAKKEVKKKDDEKEKKEMKVGLIRKGIATKKTGKEQGKAVEKKKGPVKKSVTIVNKVVAKSPKKSPVNKKAAAKADKKVVKTKGSKGEKKEEPAIKKTYKGKQVGEVSYVIPKKRSNINEEPEAGPSTSKRTKKGEEKVTKPDDEKKMREILAKIETITAENERMKASIAAFEETRSRNKNEQEVLSGEMKTAKEAAGKITASLKAKQKELKDAERKKIQLQSSTRMVNARSKNLERVIVRLKLLMDQKDVQAARYGRKALTLRTENRKMKRYLLTLRTAIERVAAGRRNSYIERLLEMADEDYDPAEEQRRIREERRRDPNRMLGALLGGAGGYLL